MVKTIDGKKYVWLQNTGYVNAKKIEDFKKGDNLAYNWGYKGKVISVKKTSPKSYTLTTSSDGKKYKRRVLAGTYKPYFKRK